MIAVGPFAAEPLVEGVDPPGVVVVGRHLPGPGPVLAAKRGLAVKGVIGSALDLGAALQGPGGIYGDDVDHSADRLAAVEGGLRPAQHLDPRDVADQKVAEVEAAAGRRRVVEPDPVDHHQGLVALRAADEQRGGLADAAVAGDGHAGLAGKNVGHHELLVRLDIRQG